MDAHAMLTLLQQALPQILGISLGDLTDATTWRFDSTEPLSKSDQALAIQTVQTALIPTTPIFVAAPPSFTDLDNIIRWAGKHVGQTLDEAKAEIAALIPVIAIGP